MKNRAFFAVFVMVLATLPAYGFVDEAAAVAQQCGAPRAQEQVTSQVTSRLELNYYYNDLILHFQPMEGGWSFTTAWHGHLPITRESLEEKLPCFKKAMAQAAAAPQQAEDPTIAEQTSVAPVDNSTFGISHLWAILALVVVLVLAAIIPSRRRGRVRPPLEGLREQVRRKPRLQGILPLRRRKPITPDSEIL